MRLLTVLLTRPPVAPQRRVGGSAGLTARPHSQRAPRPAGPANPAVADGARPQEHRASRRTTIPQSLDQEHLLLTMANSKEGGKAPAGKVAAKK
eukprot:217367-Chlamydomonas_euryale.AAC.1